MNPCLQSRGNFHIDSIGTVQYVRKIEHETKIDSTDVGNQVFIVRDDFKRLWAIKRVSTQYQNQNQGQAFKILQHLHDNHASCVPMLRQHVDDVNCTFFIFEFLNTYTTFKRFSSTRHSRKTIESVSKNIQNALDEIHKCDLHNENILVDLKTLDVKIIDFGLSTFETEINTKLKYLDLQMMDERISELHFFD